MTFNFADYWPKPSVGYLTINDFGLGADDKPYSWITWNSGDNRHFFQEDYHDGKWMSTWHLDFGDRRGVVETADEYPKFSYQVWTSYRTTKFVSGKEILWGGTQNVGDEFNAPCQIDPLGSTYFTAGTPGNQRVKFCNQYSSYTAINGKQYKNVVEIEYDQTWGSTTAGWRAFHAKGIGIVEIKWRSNGKDVGKSFGANIVTVKGTIKNKYPVLT